MDTSTVVESGILAQGWWIPLLGSAFAILMAFVMMAVKKLVAWIIVKGDFNDAEKEAMQCLLEGMTLAQDDIVRAAKAASADGKLTKEEIAAAQAKAIDYAKSVASGSAKDIVMSWSTRRASSLIKQLLAKLKSKKGSTNGDTSVNNEPAPATPESTV